MKLTRKYEPVSTLYFTIFLEFPCIYLHTNRTLWSDVNILLQLIPNYSILYIPFYLRLTESIIYFPTGYKLTLNEESSRPDL